MDFLVRTRRTDSYDLVVCGGGPSGFSCALSAARKNLKVALVERTGCLGGVSTNCGIHYFLGGRKLDETSKRHVHVVGGIFDEFTQILIDEGNAIEPDSIDLGFNPFGWYPRMASGIPCDETGIKMTMEYLLSEANVRIYYNTEVVDVSTASHSLSSVIVHNKDGFVNLASTLFADCTGDADIAMLCGCPIVKGRKEDGLVAPASVEMVLDHVNQYTLVKYQNDHNSPKLVEIIDRLRQNGQWPFPFEIFVGMRLVEPDVFLINTVRQIRIDGTDERSVSEGLMEGRKQNLQLFKIMKTHFPGFENARIRRIYDSMGIRESRRIIGKKTISIEDALSGKEFDDCIAATTYNFDLPDPEKPSHDPMMGNAKKPNSKRDHVVIEIPYGSLLPHEMDNLIVTGRSISCDRPVLGPVRIMGPCMMMGQAAGTAASLALKHANFAGIPITGLQSLLRADNLVDPRYLKTIFS
jgi:hypothetical protein